MDRKYFSDYIKILNKELVPALGCTEPIAIAFAAAKAASVLGEKPGRLIAKCSGNIIKNVKYSVNVLPDSNYRDSDNRTLGSSEIQRKVAEKLRQEVNSYINSMVNDLKRI